MEYELVAQKVNPTTHVVKNRHTNEPVAILTKPKNSYNRNEVAAVWHPDYKLLHPEVHDNLLTRNFGKNFDNMTNAVSQLTYQSKPYAFGTGKVMDPVKSQYVGEVDGIPGPYGDTKKGHKWNIHDDDGNHIASMTALHSPNEIHRDSSVNLTWNKGYYDAVPDTVKESASKKHPGKELSNTLNRVRYVIDNKGREPRFIGTYKDPSSKTKVFKTKLTPEEASAAYEEHLKTRLKSHTFSRHSPTVFSATKPADGVYGSSSQHHVLSLPGEIHHIESSFNHPDYDGSTAKKNTEVVESYVPSESRKIHPLTLEEHISVHRFLNKKVR
jgi:hypothetical protein